MSSNQTMNIPRRIGTWISRTLNPPVSLYILRRPTTTQATTHPPRPAAALAASPLGRPGPVHPGAALLADDPGMAGLQHTIFSPQPMDRPSFLRDCFSIRRPAILAHGDPPAAKSPAGGGEPGVHGRWRFFF